MKNSTHVMIWGLLAVPLGLGLFIILPPVINNANYFTVIMLCYICGYGFFIQTLIEYFDKHEQPKSNGVNQE